MCIFIVSKALLISSATVIVHAGGAIQLIPFATVLFTVCSAVTVECGVLYTCCVGVFGMFVVSLQLLRRGIWACMRYPCLCLCWVLRCGLCYPISICVVLRCSVGVSVCLVCCAFDSVYEFVGETIRNMVWCSCYFVVECYGCV